MLDLHCHLLPGIDDGAGDLTVAIEMAQAFVADGVSVVACTPHILPGVYHNSGPQIHAAVTSLQQELDTRQIPLRLVAGADNHICPSFVEKLRSGELLPLANSRYVLVEPPHHVMPPRIKDVFFDICVAGYVPILTHPERLSWVRENYNVIEELAAAGVWMQITVGSLAGTFGSTARHYAERMLRDGLVHILATDAHDPVRRKPDLARGRDLAAAIAGPEEAENLVVVRPHGVLENLAPSELPAPLCGVSHVAFRKPSLQAGQGTSHRNRSGSLLGRLRSVFEA